MKKYLVIVFLISIVLPGVISSATLSTERIGFVDLEKVFEKFPGTLNARKEFDNKKFAFDRSVKKKEEDIASMEEKYSVISSSITFFEDEIELAKERNLKEEQEQKMRQMENMKKMNEGGESAGQEQMTPESNDMNQDGNIKDTQQRINKIENMKKMDEEEIFKSRKDNNTNYKGKMQDLAVSTGSAKINFTIDQMEKMIEDYKKEIASLRKNIRDKKKDLENYNEEKLVELEDMEKNYSYNLLGEIYDVIVQVAAERTCSIVVDKNSMLYGEELSDLTDDVIKRLAEK
ncbi:MAG: OmpH family outer membrane protein [Elusimicrobiota bacterium]